MQTALSLASLVNKYLAWCCKHRSSVTTEWYEGHLAGFLSHMGAAGSIPVADLKPYHVVEWVDSHENWGDTSKRSGIVAVQRALNWAEEMGYIAMNPVKKVKKPPARRRDNPMMPEDFQVILARLREGDPFRDLFLFLWHTGCRPQEARHVEPRHVQIENQRIVILREDAKGKRHPRVQSIHPVTRPYNPSTPLRRSFRCPGGLAGRLPRTG
jgi:integrase